MLACLPISNHDLGARDRDGVFVRLRAHFFATAYGVSVYCLLCVTFVDAFCLRASDCLVYSARAQDGPKEIERN